MIKKKLLFHEIEEKHERLLHQETPEHQIDPIKETIIDLHLVPSRHKEDLPLIS